jgi:hypothetical protein
MKNSPMNLGNEAQNEREREQNPHIGFRFISCPTFQQRVREREGNSSFNQEYPIRPTYSSSMQLHIIAEWNAFEIKLEKRGKFACLTAATTTGTTRRC